MPHQSDKAVRLFQFLAQARRLREKTTVDIKSFEGKGSVAWLSDIAKGVVAKGWPIEIHPRLNDRLGMPADDVHASLNSDADGDQEGVDTILVAERPTPLTWPEPDSQVLPWLDGAADNHKRRPKLHATHPDTGASFADQPQDLQQRVEKWQSLWDDWANGMAYQDFYGQLFDAHINASQAAEEFELVLGLGLLTWANEGAKPIRRHLFTVPVTTVHEKESGRLRFTLADATAPLKAELDFVPAQALDDRTFVADVTAKAAEFGGHAFDTELFDDLGTITAHSLSTSAVYLPRGIAADPGPNPVVTWAPGLILRERQNAGFALAFEKIAEQIQQLGEVPAGLLSLIDPDQAPAPLSTPTPGAVVTFGNEVFSPLPLNEVQRRIIERVDKHSQTVVQGPPGTGKTHTAAALLSHFLAQGKRVLVTAHTERALYEVRDKLPAEIRELAVSVIGTSVTDMAELRVAVDKISRSSAEFDAEDSKRAIAAAENNLNSLRETRQQLLQNISSEFRRKSEPLKIPGYELAPALAAQKVREQAPKYKWIREFVSPDAALAFPLAAEEVEKYCEVFPKLRTVDPQQVAATQDVDTSDLPNVADFSAVDQALKQLHQEHAQLRTTISKKQAATLAGLSVSERKAAMVHAVGLRKIVEEIRSHARPWSQALLQAYDQAELEAWRNKAEEVRQQVDKISSSLDHLSGFQKVSINGNAEALLPYAKNLAEHLSAKGPLKTDVHGNVKIGVFSPTIVKEGKQFFDSVKVDGAQPATVEQVRAVVAKIQLEWAAETLREELPEWLHRDDNDPAALVAGINADLTNALAAAESLAAQQPASQLAQRFHLAPTVDSIPSVISALENYSRMLEIDRQVEHKQQRIKKLLSRVAAVVEKHRRVRWLAAYHEAARKGNFQGMQQAFDEGAALREQHSTIRTFETLEKKLRAWSPAFVDTLRAQDRPQQMLEQLRDVHAALQWHDAFLQVNEGERYDLAQLQGEVKILDNKIHAQVRTLAAERAWYEALNSNRITGRTRKNLVEYAQSVKRLGKGTGKHADRRRREIRKALDNCRSAVPVWIMPLHRLIDQLDLQGNMFDVVMVDEASQAGSEAAFLQYLAPTIVVIGDDKQVSPSAIGVSEDELRKLADQFLSDDDDKPGWCDTKRSLFDIALARFGGRLTLTEHRRCVPEIIGFSNQIAYEPDNITLIPVREITADRLEPFKIVHTPHAYQDKNTGKVNRGEADALVAQLQECITDPSYADKTIGVISLLSSSKQADYIQARLLEVLPPDVWEKHQLRVGTPAEFQGAERDVIFLSMVTAKDPDVRLASLTKEEYVQRYNVAVSRAKDQVWLFHSIGLDQLTNPEDMRYKLLQYAYNIVSRPNGVGASAKVSDTERVEPFDSLFEQRVYNALVDRGYHVIPQFNALQYRIDLVVQGAQTRLAVECDGDNWHGPEHAERDLARQRELERVGWTFVRIFESDFYLDRDTELERVFTKLNELGIEAQGV